MVFKGQKVMTDYTRDSMSVCVCVHASVCTPLNHKHAFFPQCDSHGKPNQRLSFKKSPGIYIQRWQAAGAPSSVYTMPFYN